MRLQGNWKVSSERGVLSVDPITNATDLLYCGPNFCKAVCISVSVSSPVVITTNAESGASVREGSDSLPIINLYISELSSFGGWACRPGGVFNCS